MPEISQKLTSNCLFTKLKQIKSDQLVNPTLVPQTPQQQLYGCIKVTNLQFQHLQKIAKFYAQHVANIYFARTANAANDDSVNTNIAVIISQIESSIEASIRQLIEMKAIPNLQLCYSPKNLDSTVGDSLRHQKTLETPSFDVETGKTVRETPSNRREFTLGNKKQNSSNSSCGGQKVLSKEVSQFSLIGKQSSSRRIKNRIMNSSNRNNK